MKKIFYTIGLCLLAVSCSDDYTDWANPLTNAQEPIETTGLSVTAPEALDVADVEGDAVKLFTPALDNDYDEVTYTVTLATEDGSKSVDVAADAEGNVTVEDLQNAIRTIYGARPTERTVPYTVTAIAKKNGQAYKMTSRGTIKLTPKAPVIEAAYYYVGASNGWSTTDQTYKLVNGGGDVYEDPVFTVLIPAPVDEEGARAANWFKLAPESAYARENFWDGDMVGAAVNGQSDLEGSFVVGKNDEVALAFCVGAADDEALYYRLEFNMLDQTYKVTPVGFNEYIYEIGNESGWSENHPLRGDGNGYYSAVHYLDGEFKFKPNADNWDGDYEKVSGDATGGTLTTDGGPNVDAVEAGFYFIEVNLKEMTYKLTPITAISIIGSVIGNWDTDVDMTYNEVRKAWEARATLAAGEFKFRANHGWDINWGGTEDDLTQGGANLQLPADGNYVIRLYLSDEAPAHCTVEVDNGFIYEIGGESGWATSHPLAGDGTGKYTGFYYLNGEYKFKPNADNWDGDFEKAEGDAYAGTLQTEGGPNVDAPEAGFYKIDVDLNTLSYQLTAISSVSIIGSVKGAWDTDVDLTYNADAGCWEVTAELGAGEWKFRANHDWAINWGGSESDLTQDGSNLNLAEAGTYRIQLFLSYAGAHNCTVIKQ